MHGFITKQRIHQSAYTEFHKGLTCQKKGYEISDLTEKRELYKVAIEYYEKALEKDPQHSPSYNNCGVAKQDLGEYIEAMIDFDKAIEIDSEYIIAIYNRGLCRLCLSEWGNAEKDLTTAKDKGANIVIAFHRFEKDIPTFEKKHNIKLPLDIVTLLTPDKDKS